MSQISLIVVRGHCTTANMHFWFRSTCFCVQVVMLWSFWLRWFQVSTFPHFMFSSWVMWFPKGAYHAQRNSETTCALWKSPHPVVLSLEFAVVWNHNMLKSSWTNMDEVIFKRYTLVLYFSPCDLHLLIITVLICSRNKFSWSQAASGNYASSQESMCKTFALSNMAPQNASMNRGIWWQASVKLITNHLSRVDVFSMISQNSYLLQNLVSC